MASDEQPTSYFFDSLPYYDNDLELHPVLRERVQHELAVETQKLQSEALHPRIPPAVELFANHPLLAAEMERVERREPLAAIETTRYQLPAPSSVSATDEEWKAALDNAYAQLEHQRIRHNNLALLQQYGGNAWRIHNYLLEADTKHAEKLLEELKNQTTDVNRDRKNAQTRIGNQLNSLETRWTELISSVLQIEMANVALEGEVDRLNKRETELASAFPVACPGVPISSPSSSGISNLCINTDEDVVGMSAKADRDSPSTNLCTPLLFPEVHLCAGRIVLILYVAGSLRDRLCTCTKPAIITQASVASGDAFMDSVNTTTQGTSGLNGSVEEPRGLGHDGASQSPANDSGEQPPNAAGKTGGDAASGSSTSSNLTPLKGVGSAFATGSSSGASVSAPHPKKFVAVNINKKFMEARLVATGSSQVSSSSATLKSSGSIAKPTPLATSSHSRLVTTKLTATAQPSTTTGPGWSRPSSAAPSNVTPSPGPTTGPANQFPAPTPSSQGPPQLPHVGKVIQPQPRGVAATPEAPNGSSKPVWGNLKSSVTGAARPDVRVQSDFPTAAEVAQVRIPKHADKKQVVQPAAPQNQSMIQEAEAFRGVHLDPNAHHWDEMEEDNDDFLGGVIEFGDGRQYKIQAADSPSQRASPPRDARSPSGPARDQTEHAPEVPEASRVLFNERSNKLEPYSSAHPRIGPSASPETPAIPLGVDVEEVRKAAMHSAAERARLRRQQEEEEREKERERARRKAAELEEKINAQQMEKEGRLAPDAKAREDSKAAEPPKEGSTSQPEPASSVQGSQPPSSLPEKPALARPPSQKPTARDIDNANRPWMTRTTSQRSSQGVISPPTFAAAETESWRRKAGPLPPLATRTAARPPPAQVTSPVTPLPPAPKIPEIEMLNLQPDESLEEVDFTDLARFVGAEEKVPKMLPQPHSVPPHRGSRPVASDFFDDRPPPLTREPSKGDVAPTWRRTMSMDGTEERPTLPSIVTQADPVRRSASKPILSPTSRPPQSVLNGPLSPVNPHPWTEHPSANGLAALNHPSQRLSRMSSAFREAPMSTLDDTMSRIKGALDAQRGSQRDTSTESSTDGRSPEKAMPAAASQDKVESPTPPKWVPPAMRPRPPASQVANAPPFSAVTASDPPEITPRAWNTYTVKLAKVTARVPLSKQQLHLWKLPSMQFRWDMLSWDPPVSGMSRKDLSVNDILVGKPSLFKGKPKYRVVLSKGWSSTADPDSIPQSPRVNLPSQSPVVRSAATPVSSRLHNAENMQSWRQKPAATPDRPSTHLTVQQLETVSRSPPPDSDSSDGKDGSSSKQEPDDNSAADASSRSRVQPKMPAGASVAFYRDSQAEKPKAPVKFGVNSELEQSQQQEAVAALSSDDPIVTSAKAVRLEQAPIGSEVKSPSAARHKSQGSVLDGPLDPSSSPWTKATPMKDSPARAPDPEHLKMVWSQTSSKAKGVNSLEGIADDLISVPFTLQDVKSEDGETPPPTVSSGPSRMSLHDVTRAFQQVPSPPSGSSSQKQTPTTSHPNPAPRQPSYHHPSGSNSGMRPAYPGYSSPMMSHSPAPTVMYPPVMTPSPVAGPMMVNGPTPQYGHAVWMPATGTPGAVMRPVPAPSPYPTQWSYAPPGAPPAMYTTTPPTMPQSQPSQNQPKGGANAPNRGRTSSVMSPVMSHVGMPHPGMPMYQQSPVMMHAHAPAMQVPPTYPAPMPSGRGEMRSPYAVHAVPMMHQAPPHNRQPYSHPPPPSHQHQHQHPHPGNYAHAHAPAPPASYPRPPW
ncbi:hypothetical protein EWM64_g1944 [Hericium alpestre]|uniref:Breast carcinoma amplified sequence 2 n=1 Tax=Hericium alpestre TaxID=135208 RepID=A0A4Z0A706_9AGAM|nr:hypothetical protein EWM64_g1944 [Hericium alpestre]